MADKKLEHDAGLDQPLEVAVERYVALTAEEAQDADMLPASTAALDRAIKKLASHGRKVSKPKRKGSTAKG